MFFFSFHCSFHSSLCSFQQIDFDFKIYFFFSKGKCLYINSQKTFYITMYVFSVFFFLLFSCFCLSLLFICFIFPFHAPILIMNYIWMSIFALIWMLAYHLIGFCLPNNKKKALASLLHRCRFDIYIFLILLLFLCFSFSLFQMWNSMNKSMVRKK